MLNLRNPPTRRIGAGCVLALGLLAGSCSSSDSGGATAPEAQAATERVAEAPAGPVSLQLKATPGGKAVGTRVTWVATSDGGTTPHSYKFFVYDGEWHVIQDWSTASSVTWTPARTHPNATIEVRVRSAGNSTDSHEAAAVGVFAIAAGS